MDPVDNRLSRTPYWRRRKVGYKKRKEGYVNRESKFRDEKLHQIYIHIFIRSWRRRRYEKRKKVKETRFTELRREKAKINSSVTELLIPTTLMSENTPHNSQQRKRADWKQTHCLTEKEGHRQEEAWSKISGLDDKELKINEFPVENASETPHEKEGVETGAAPSSADSPNIRRTMTC
ncbi:uncharacterized protein MONOS_16629 [Monocercomonoides exilis]|uniref:uncharacterized protein n=1 Tax=Monocercomonoides exilis TaxID=2049356 RepID=UPI003559685D|nr:hypothetical protein MONOS_16629 [Monocercomonoides exilis]|eukprot:MONOS_16629.1-p1 / transcript=MONOS_16629.1 / gene=MONOS_16629 / organism=Monocercomonoides_exilis_PA203 / gene_product=unspecified product / transcript_product=unspecified product / location=Mono_scaffold01949:2288-2821(+) / protein_length=178 / sequence_SO=supercontig / SO=protein_coding / is_pseudo=false